MSDIIIGRNSVIEYLENLEGAKELLIQKGDLKGVIKKIIEISQKNKLNIKYVEKRELDRISDNQNHQGVILKVEEYKYHTLEELILYGKNSDRDPLIIILDEITDPHNLGAIIRTSEAAAATGVIIPKHRAASVNHTVHKTSAGATAHMRVCQVTNINRTIETLKKEGYWVYGADGHTNKYYTDIDFTGPVALVIGNEGRGISRLTKEKCDELIKIPMYGKTESLNASTSAAILIYGVLQNRK